MMHSIDCMCEKCIKQRLDWIKISSKNLTKGCGKMFQPWGESKEESWWKCGDKHNGKHLLCPKCYKPQEKGE